MRKSFLCVVLFCFAFMNRGTAEANEFKARMEQAAKVFASQILNYDATDQEGTLDVFYRASRWMTPACAGKWIEWYKRWIPGAALQGTKSSVSVADIDLRKGAEKGTLELVARIFLDTSIGGNVSATTGTLIILLVPRENAEDGMIVAGFALITDEGIWQSIFSVTGKGIRMDKRKKP